MRKITSATEPGEKLYRSISEVSKELDVKPHVLRYWETQFSSLRPRKSRAGNRMYRAEELELLQKIKDLLYDRRFTIEGARRHLLEERRGKTRIPSKNAKPPTPDTATDRQKVVQEVRRDLTRLSRQLRQDKRVPVTVRS